MEDLEKRKRIAEVDGWHSFYLSPGYGENAIDVLFGINGVTNMHRPVPRFELDPAAACSLLPKIGAAGAINWHTDWDEALIGFLACPASPERDRDICNLIYEAICALGEG